MMMSKKAEMGIGTLILFIAMILVAAVAAGVLIQTASSLQTKALLTGTKSTAEVSTSMQVLYVYGTEASSSVHNLQKTYLKVKLSPGSDPIKIDDTVITVQTQTLRSSYNYDNAAYCNGTSFPTTGSYGVNYLSGTPALGVGYLARADIILVCFPNPENIDEGQEYSVSLLPRAGQVATVALRAPDVLVQSSVPLYP